MMKEMVAFYEPERITHV